MGDVINVEFGKAARRASDEDLRPLLLKGIGDALQWSGVGPRATEICSAQVVDAAMEAVKSIREACLFRFQLSMDVDGMTPKIEERISADLTRATQEWSARIADAIVANVVKSCGVSAAFGAMAMQAS